jgi:hypothetical protein
LKTKPEFFRVLIAVSWTFFGLLEFVHGERS